MDGELLKPTKMSKHDLQRLKHIDRIRERTRLPLRNTRIKTTSVLPTEKAYDGINSTFHLRTLKYAPDAGVRKTWLQTVRKDWISVTDRSLEQLQQFFAHLST